jgi:nitroreductase
MKYDLSEINEIIQNRRTIYPEFFSERKVHKEQIEGLLRNATWAPTHGMTQPWRFKVFMGEGLSKFAKFQSELYTSITEKEAYNERKFDKLQNRPLKSSAVIAICMQRQKSQKIPEIEEIAAVSCAVQNMLLTGTAYGLAIHWTSSTPTYRTEMKSFLGLENNDRCLGFLYIGYPKDEWPKGQRKPIEYVTDWINE